MICHKCGGVLATIKVEEYPECLEAHKIVEYNRVCDVKCLTCEEVYYSQGYDEGTVLNLVKDIKQKKK